MPRLEQKNERGCVEVDVPSGGVVPWKCEPLDVSLAGISNPVTPYCPCGELNRLLTRWATRICTVLDKTSMFEVTSTLRDGRQRQHQVSSSQRSNSIFHVAQEESCSTSRVGATAGLYGDSALPGCCQGVSSEVSKVCDLPPRPG